MPASHRAVDRQTSRTTAPRAAPAPSVEAARPRDWIGPATLGAVAVGNVAVWLLARPPGQPGGRYFGEICGAEAILLFSATLVLATLLTPVERAFGGLDRV